jgi:poly(hydroxyalkanoate) depolymerase family esterase
MNRRARRCALALGAFALVSLPGGPAAADEPTADPGRVTSGTVTSNGNDFEYILYTPTTYRKREGAPLLVAVHGCQTTAEQQMRVSLYNQLAERKGFVVLYPDVDAVGRALPGPLNQCWKFPDPTSYFRGTGDAAAIADMTQFAMAKRAIDPDRVYLAGISAGGLMASIEAAAYPDLYAAVAVMSSAGYADGPCFTNGVGIPVEVSAQLAHTVMGPHARVVPRLVLGGDADLAFPWTCTQKALDQGLRTNNLVLSGSQTGSISLAPASTEQRRVPGGRTYTISRYRDPDGCLVGESWKIHGMGHYWSGGSDDPAVAGYSDVTGPSAAKATWRFFSRFRNSHTVACR